MSLSSENRTCIPQCKLSVPKELDSVGLCVYHFTWSVEEACAEMHRQIALRKATSERRAQMAGYIGDCALLLARLTSNLCMTDDLKRRVLCAFQSLMNLKDNLEHAPLNGSRELQITEPEPTPTFVWVPDWLNLETNASVRSEV